MRSRRRWNTSRLARASLALLVAGGLLLTVTLVTPIVLPLSTEVGDPVGFAHTTPASAPAPITVLVRMTDAPSFVPNTISVDAGSNVTFDLQNVGNYTHTFTLLRQANVTLSPSLTPDQLNAYIRENGSAINESVAPGGTALVTYNVPLTTYSMTFEYVCVVAYQFQAGMHGTLSVIPTIGGNATLSDNTTNALSFVPDVLEINTTGIHFPINVTITLTNLGSLEHTWSLVPQPGVNITPTNFTAYFEAHPALANITVTPSGGSGSFLMDGPGVYMYICEEPGHFASGMYGHLYVGVAPPPPSAVSTTIVYAWVLAVALGIVGVGVVLSFAVSYTGRFPKPPAGGAPPEGGHY